MKKTILVFMVFLFSLGLGGCVSMPLKQYSEVLPKTNSVRLEKTVFCKLREVNLGFKLSFEEPIENPSAEQLELLEVYGVCLKEELGKRGFAVTDDSSKEGTLVIKSKIGEVPGNVITSGLGIVGAEVEVWDNDKLLLSFQQGANTHFLSVSTQKGIRAKVAPCIARKLKEKFL